MTMSEEITRKLPANVLEEILSELKSMRAEMNAMQSQMNSMQSQMNSMQSEIGSMRTEMGAMNERLTSLEQRVDQRLKETRPIWELVVVRLDKVEARLDSLDGKFDGLTQEFHSLKGDFKDLAKKVDDKIEDLALDMRAGFKRLERRMAELAGEWNEVRTGSEGSRKTHGPIGGSASRRARRINLYSDA
jgi:chromosome segregation ATPase